MNTSRVFEGLKVVDLASFLAGPGAATVLSDFGADVVKVEPPEIGDPRTAYMLRAIIARIGLTANTPQEGCISSGGWMLTATG